MPEALVVGAVAGAILAAVIVLIRLGARSATSGEHAPRVRAAAGRAVVTLEVDGAAGRGEPARRLAVGTAAPLFLRDDTLLEVEVRDRSGGVVAVVDRSEGLELADRDPFAESATDRLDLPETVRSKLSEDASLAEVVAAILAAAGHTVTVDRDVVRIGDRAVVALESTDADELSGAFLRYRASGATSGVVVSRRAVPPPEVHRRELLAPDLRYAPAGALQRMADAVVVDADPIAFALASFRD